MCGRPEDGWTILESSTRIEPLSMILLCLSTVMIVTSVNSVCLPISRAIPESS